MKPATKTRAAQPTSKKTPAQMLKTKYNPRLKHKYAQLARAGFITPVNPDPILPGDPRYTPAIEMRALRRAARTARKLAKMHGTKLWYYKNGKIIGVEP